jgi:hypothetical protein
VLVVNSLITALRGGLHGRWPLATLLLAGISWYGCGNDPVMPELSGECAPVASGNAMNIPDCLFRRSTISETQRDHALQVLEQSTVTRDSILNSGTEDAFRLSTLLTLAAQHLTDFYARGLLGDSALSANMDETPTPDSLV